MFFVVVVECSSRLILLSTTSEYSRTFLVLLFLVVAILDVMEVLGWSFRFQYDSESHSAKVNGSSFTSRELFIFHKSG